MHRFFNSNRHTTMCCKLHCSFIKSVLTTFNCILLARTIAQLSTNHYYLLKHRKMSDSEDDTASTSGDSSSPSDHEQHADLNPDDEEAFMIDSDMKDDSSESENDGAEQTTGVNWNLPFRDDAEEFDLFTHAQNSDLQLSDISTPFEILQKLITEEMVASICEESLRYAQQKQNWTFTSFTEADFWRFLAMQLGMGIDRKPERQMYWSRKCLFHTPFFGETMPRDQFDAIMKNLHFVNNEEVPKTNTDRFIKLGGFMDNLIANFKTSVHPGEYLCLDESLVPFKGRLSIKQYNPKKRARFGVKLFLLADCATKMIIDIVPYQGKHTKMKNKELMNELGFGGTTVLSMLEPYFGMGHRVVVDNWFTSPRLANLLKEKNTYILGMVQKNRKGMPKNSSAKKKLSKGEVQLFSDGNILLERWRDRREIFILNTFMPHTMIESESSNPRNTREKPGSVLLYNSKMGAVDDVDKVIKPYCANRKSYKWYRKIGFHLMNIAIYNSFLLHRQLTRKKIPYMDYLMELISNILLTHPKQATSRGRPGSYIRDVDRLTGQHFPQKAVKTNGTKSRSDCAYCKKVYSQRKTTLFKCMKCNKHLCIGPGASCFYLYHTKSKLKKISLPKAARKMPPTVGSTNSLVPSSSPANASPEVSSSVVFDSFFEYSDMLQDD